MSSHNDLTIPLTSYVIDDGKPSSEYTNRFPSLVEEKAFNQVQKRSPKIELEML